MPIQHAMIAAAAGIARPPLRGACWRRIGLRGNPFRALAPDEVAGMLDETRRAVALAGLAAPQPVVEIVGHSGWGKSTLLALMRRSGRQRGECWVCACVRPEDDRPPEPVWDKGAPHCSGDSATDQLARRWCIDEAQRIAPRVLRRTLMRAAAGESASGARSASPACRSCLV